MITASAAATSERAGIDRARDASGSDSRGHSPGELYLPMTEPAKAPWLRRHGRSLLLVLLLAAIEISYVAIISAGAFTTWPTWNNNYDLLAEGFRSGHLYMTVPPRPELLAKADPFNPAWRSLWFWDASLHDGHYYLYWGPFPAVVLALFKTVFRIRATIGDQYPCSRSTRSTSSRARC